MIFLGFVFTNLSCSIFKSETITDGWTESNTQSKVLYNKLIENDENNSPYVFGQISPKDEEKNIGLTLIFKNLVSEKVYRTQTDFDGNYSISLPNGNYDMLLVNDKIILKKIDLKNGDKRRIDLEIIFGPETTISVEYPTKRAWKKAQRNNKERN